MTQQTPAKIIDTAWENRASLSPGCAQGSARGRRARRRRTERGKLRVATRQGVGQWTVNQWVKKAVLLSFRLNDNVIMKAGELAFFDKVPTKFSHLSPEEMAATGVRVVPPAVARRGSFIAKGAILMPSAT
jgi:2,3,4,5-tetrahydropyridine-2-carboxylate N-succinyltransferase